jgi:hypothetical protein
MSEIEEKIDQLQARLENLVKSQEYFQRETSQIRYEINVLRAVQQKRRAQQQSQQSPKPEVYIPPSKSSSSPQQTPVEEIPPSERTPQTHQQTNYSHEQANQSQQTNYANVQPFPSKTFSGYSNSRQTNPSQAATVAARSNLEKFIGENLISKIGILILVIGVAIGAKYAIDNNFISPLARIILGYVFGFSLLGFAVKLKSKYHSFSAVLLSGGMAIMYFITYFAHAFYDLISQPTAFVLMLIFTVFTVLSAINFNRQIIAHIGLVGAYAIPFLLSDNSGRFAFFFSYIAIINAGILAVSVKKYWKPLFYSSFVFTWAIFYAWRLGSYRSDEHFNLALFFLTIFFLTFYLTFLAYKLVSEENVAVENVALILANSFIFYGLGYWILNNHEGFEGYLGLFTILNAAIHLIFAFGVSRLQSVSQDLIYLLAALVLTFATIAVPVQLDGNWVTLVWTAEAAILFWIGRTKQIPVYENYSFPVMFLAGVSLLADWLAAYDYRPIEETMQSYNPLLNGTFIASIFFVLAFAFIHFLNRDQRFEPALGASVRQILIYLIPIAALFVLYNAFRMEIGSYFYFQIAKTAAPTGDMTPYGYSVPRTDGNLEFFNVIWQINYTMLFLTVLTFVNIKRWKSAALAFTNLILSILVLMIFLTVGLYLLGELRESYLLQTGAENFKRGAMHILVRYFSYAFVAGLIFAFYSHIKQNFLREVLPENGLRLAFDFVFYSALWLILSSELINLMDIFGYKDSYKLGLSILWGIYALSLIVLGIYQHKKHLRIGAIALFAFTLVKLFFYDIAELDTISKTIIFVSLGIILLIVSFLYNKYKYLIFETEACT